MQSALNLYVALNLITGVGAIHPYEPSNVGVADVTPEEGEALMQECINEEALSCYTYAFYAAKKLANLATYRLALKRGCRLRHLESCERLARDNKEWEGARKKCGTGDADSCALYSLGRALMYADLNGAIDYANRACGLGHKMSCARVKVEQEKLRKKK